MASKKTVLRRSAIAVATVAALTLSACAGGANNSATKSSETKPATKVKSSDFEKVERSDMKKGGTLTRGIVHITEQENPFHGDMDAYTSALWRYYNPQLSLFDGDGNWSANPAYLTDVKAEEKNGKTVVTYTINEKAQYNDGTPIDWRAFENTWKFNNGKDFKDVSVNSTDGYDRIESVTPGANDKQAVVTFNGIWLFWKGLFGTLVPTQVKDAQTFNEGFLNKVHPEWGAGPYKVDNIDFQGGTATFVPNEKWWGNPAMLDKVVYRQVESKAAINAFKGGEIDAVGASSKDNFAAVKGMGEQAKIFTGASPATSLMTLNSKSPALSDIKVREAVMKSIDRKQLSKIRFNGVDYNEEPPGSFLLFPFQNGYKDNFSEAVKYDVDGAKKILAGDGYTQNKDGIFEKDGKPLTLHYVSTGDAEITKNLAAAIQQMLKGAGISVEIKNVPSAEYSKVLKNLDFDLFLSGFGASDPYGIAYIQQTYASDSTLNKSGTGSPELDKKLEAVFAAKDEKTQIDLANTAEVEAFKTFGLMPLFNGPDIIAVKPGLANVGAPGFSVTPVENIGWKK